MHIPIWLIILVPIVAALLGWLARGYMHRTDPVTLREWDDRGNAVGDKIESAYTQAKDTVGSRFNK